MSPGGYVVVMVFSRDRTAERALVVGRQTGIGCRKGIIEHHSQRTRASTQLSAVRLICLALSRAKGATGLRRRD